MKKVVLENATEGNADGQASAPTHTSVGSVTIHAHDAVPEPHKCGHRAVHTLHIRLGQLHVPLRAHQSTASSRPGGAGLRRNASLERRRTRLTPAS